MTTTTDHVSDVIKCSLSSGFSNHMHITQFITVEIADEVRQEKQREE